MDYIWNECLRMPTPQFSLDFRLTGSLKERPPSANIAIGIAKLVQVGGCGEANLHTTSYLAIGGVARATMLRCSLSQPTMSRIICTALRVL